MQCKSGGYNVCPTSLRGYVETRRHNRGDHNILVYRDWRKGGRSALRWIGVWSAKFVIIQQRWDQHIAYAAVVATLEMLSAT
jgi:hypothetical protein